MRLRAIRTLALTPRQGARLMMYPERTWGAKGFRPFSIATCLGALLVAGSLAFASHAPAATTSKPKLTQAAAQKAAGKGAPKLTPPTYVVHYTDPEPMGPINGSYTSTFGPYVPVRLGRCARGLILHGKNSGEAFGCEVTWHRQVSSEPPQTGLDGTQEFCERLIVGYPSRHRLPYSASLTPPFGPEPDFTFTIPGTSYSSHEPPPRRLAASIRIKTGWYVLVRAFTVAGDKAGCPPTLLP